MQKHISEEEETNGHYETITTTFWKPEKKGETIEGLVGGSVETSYGHARQIRDKNNGTIILVNYTALNDKLAGLEGEQVRITYKGEEKSKAGKDYKDFDIAVWKTR